MPQLTPIAQPSAPEVHEEEYVHSVYENIALHFSNTRYKPWPLVSKFLESQSTGSIGLDSGTGNGKYLPLDQAGGIHMIGLDRSRNLLQIAKHAGGKEQDVVVGDALGQACRCGAFDFAISIATIHHLSTPERRQNALESLIRALSPSHGRLLVYVWATEQDDASKRVVPSNPSHSDDENVATGTGQDALVPWVLTQSQPHNANDPATPQDNQNQVYQRYYHFFAPGELRELVCLAGRSLDLDVGVPPNPGHDPIPTSTRPCRRGMEIVNEGWERSNYYIEVKLWETGT